MSFKHKRGYPAFLLIIILLFLSIEKVSAQEIYICRPLLEKDSIFMNKKVTVHGDYFGYLIFPGNFPSHNDLSGEEDRFNFGFQNILFLGKNTRLLVRFLPPNL